MYLDHWRGIQIVLTPSPAAHVQHVCRYSINSSLPGVLTFWIKRPVALRVYLCLLGCTLTMRRNELQLNWVHQALVRKFFFFKREYYEELGLDPGGCYNLKKNKKLKWRQKNVSLFLQLFRTSVEKVAIESVGETWPETSGDEPSLWGNHWINKMLHSFWFKE